MHQPNRILSFDIGIKNLAYCYLETPFDVTDTSYTTILDWKVINLMSTAEEVPSSGGTQQPSCNCMLSMSTKKNQIMCGKPAKYKFSKPDSSETLYFCDRHAKSNTTYLIPKRTYEEAYLMKQKKDVLINLMTTLGIAPQDAGVKKAAMVKQLLEYFSKVLLSPIKATSSLAQGSTTANDLDLITIGRNMITLLDRIEIFKTYPPTHIILENQISTIASRMKTIQGELTMYFLMRYPNAYIEYISSRNKLKQFETAKPARVVRKAETDTQTARSKEAANYRKHKEDAIMYTNQILQNHSQLNSWSYCMKDKKKDDLADCFLQGLYFMKAKLR
jgi:Mitochondrial resolvase Ydc2 / RNA splicing MRS1